MKVRFWRILENVFLFRPKVSVCSCLDMSLLQLSLTIVYPLLKLDIIEESNRDRVSVEYPSFECVHSLRYGQRNSVLMSVEMKFTRRADNWLVNLTKTGTGGCESRGMKTRSTLPYCTGIRKADNQVDSISQPSVSILPQSPGSSFHLPTLHPGLNH